MKKLKFKSGFSVEDIKLLYQSSMLHADMTNDFGLFCAGAAVVLRSVFNQLQSVKAGTKMEMNTTKIAITTVCLLEGFDEVKRDLIAAEMDEKIDNKSISEKILAIAREVREERRKMDAISVVPSVYKKGD